MWLPAAAAVVFILDFFTKWIALRDLHAMPGITIGFGDFLLPSASMVELLQTAPVYRVPVIAGWFDLFLQRNTGGAFSLLDNYPFVIMGVSAVAMVWI